MPNKNKQGALRPLPKTTILFFVGIFLVIHEAVGRGDADPRVELLIVYLFMMGMPIAEISDMLRQKVIRDWAGEDDEDEERDSKSRNRS